MKKIKDANSVRIIGVKNFEGEDKLIDYYVTSPERQEKIYAFSKIYTNHSYELCKSGIRVNDLVCVRSRDTGVMRLVNYARLIIPYLTEQYEIPTAA